MRAFGFYHTTTRALAGVGEAPVTEPEADVPDWTPERGAAWRAWGARQDQLRGDELGERAIPVTRPASRGPWLERLLNGGRPVSA